MTIPFGETGLQPVDIVVSDFFAKRFSFIGNAVQGKECDRQEHGGNFFPKRYRTAGKRKTGMTKALFRLFAYGGWFPVKADYEVSSRREGKTGFILCTSNLPERMTKGFPRGDVPEKRGIRRPFLPDAVFSGA